MEYFCCYNSYAKACQNLSDAELGRLFRALMAYNADGAIADLSGREIVAFDFIVANIDRERERYEQKCEKNSQNGKAGAEKRWANNSKRHNDDSENSERHKRYNKNSENSQEKDKEEDKDKEKDNNKPLCISPFTSKKQKYASYVTMTNDEHEKLIATYGEIPTKRMIEILDNYKGSNGKTYKSDYRAILNWVVDRYKEETSKYGTKENAGYDSNRTVCDGKGYNLDFSKGI